MDVSFSSMNVMSSYRLISHNDKILVMPAKITLFNAKGNKVFDFIDGSLNKVFYSPNGKGNRAIIEQPIDYGISNSCYILVILLAGFGNLPGDTVMSKRIIISLQ
jgi:uncharacterized protein with WD repeat